jgi:hypothetical protein
MPRESCRNTELRNFGPEPIDGLPPLKASGIGKLRMLWYPVCICRRIKPKIDPCLICRKPVLRPADRTSRAQAMLTMQMRGAYPARYRQEKSRPMGAA